MEYRVALPDYHGPLDLLLFLVKRNEVDLRDIPIAAIADQFRAYLEVLAALDFEQVGDFLVTAATLVEIKSRLLLPRNEEPADPETESDDPRRELVKQLIEYKKFKDAAARLETRAAEHQRRMPRHEVAAPAEPTGPPPVQAVELWDLVSAFGRIMQEAADLQPDQVVVDETPQQVYREQVLEKIAAGRCSFRDLFQPPYIRTRLIGLFLAVLELIKDGLVTLEQDGLFGEICLLKSERSESPAIEPNEPRTE